MRLFTWVTLFITTTQSYWRFIVYIYHPLSSAVYYLVVAGLSRVAKKKSTHILLVHTKIYLLQPMMTRATIHHLLLYIALLYCIQSCLSIPQNIDDNSLKITPLNHPNNNNNDNDNIPTNTEKYNIHDHTIYQRKWNEYLKNGRDSRQSREPIHVDYMGMRKFLLFSVVCISTCSVKFCKVHFVCFWRVHVNTNTLIIS